MALLPILRYPNPRLNRVASPVSIVDEAVRKLAANMLETMYAAPGVGLAATQVDVHRRLIVMDISEDHSCPMIFINPDILNREGECEDEEGCLSVPGIREKVRRSATIKVAALNLSGKRMELEAEGLLAVCIQHEIDHLDGHLFVEYLSPLKQTRIKNKFLKQSREK
ncbi:MAG: peptide deformylase [Rhodocyclaceae bacterium]|nr:peptide deformylase [Rhodocyclaceae bacterium]